MSGRHLTRRAFAKATAGLGLSLAGGALLAGCTSSVAPYFSPLRGNQLETTRIRLTQMPGICIAPQYVATDLLRAEGFANVEYVQAPSKDPYAAFSDGSIDISMSFAAPFLAQLDKGDPIMLLGGVHVGCFEVIGSEGVRAIRDLKGKTVGIPGFGTGQHLFLAAMVAYVGLDPNTDINWFIHDLSDSARVMTDGSVDALIAFPPVPQELRAKQIGHTVVNSATDKPWSQYFCCTLAGHRDFLQHNPVASKRALRAILKAADLCANEPERAARLMVDGGFTANYDYALQTMKEIPYNRWREYDPEDTLRFYALRLHDIGMISSSPEQLIQKGADWRYFNELKQELKG